MADEQAEGTKKTLATRAKEEPLSHLLRTISTVILLPVIGWLIIDKLNGIDGRISAHDTKFETIEGQLGTIVANQSAGQAQRDAQQKQLDSFESWLQRMADRVNGKH